MEQIHSKYSEELDSLPYIDIHYEGMQEKVNALIEEEMRSFTPPNYLQDFEEIELKFEGHPALMEELKRVEESIKKSGPNLPREPLRVLNTSNYLVNPPSKKQENDVQEWRLALNNALTQLQHAYIREENLLLLDKYGPNAWKQYSVQLQNILKMLQLKLDGIKKEIEELNVKRKTDQMACGMSLQDLESQWIALIHKNLEIEAACASLENEIAVLKRSKDID